MKLKLFYGWYIVAAGLLLMGYTGWAFMHGFTAFVNPIIATFGWSYAQVSLGSSIRGLEAGTLDPFVGVAADRWPAKRLMIIVYYKKYVFLKTHLSNFPAPLLARLVPIFVTLLDPLSMGLVTLLKVSIVLFR